MSYVWFYIISAFLGIFLLLFISFSIKHRKGNLNLSETLSNSFAGTVYISFFLAVFAFPIIDSYDYPYSCNTVEKYIYTSELPDNPLPNTHSKTMQIYKLVESAKPQITKECKSLLFLKDKKEVKSRAERAKYELVEVPNPSYKEPAYTPHYSSPLNLFPQANYCPITTCCDGTCSRSTGRGTCSHHGGVCGYSY